MDDDEDWLGLDLNGSQPVLKGSSDRIGHNSLVSAVEMAKAALSRVRDGEEMSWEAWRDYGKALNEGREAFPSDEEFGQWVVSEGLGKFVSGNLPHTKSVEKHERIAAMWIASEPEEEQEALSLFPNARTPRGLYSKWLSEIKRREAEPSGGSNPNLRLPSEKEEKRIRNLKDRAASTNSEPEREAALKQLAKMEGDGIDVSVVKDQKEDDEERDEYFDEKRKREGAAERLARHFLSKNSVRHIRHLILVAYPETKDLEQFELDILEGETNV